MAILQLVGEEEIEEESIDRYYGNLYRVVAISERPPGYDQPAGTVRTTYIVDWEQLVHLLEDYEVFGEDIVEVSQILSDDARMLRYAAEGQQHIARA